MGRGAVAAATAATSASPSPSALLLLLLLLLLREQLSALSAQFAPRFERDSGHLSPTDAGIDRANVATTAAAAAALGECHARHHARPAHNTAADGVVRTEPALPRRAEVGAE